jgi:tRNA (guanine26-N2/guanine27-N2)-dimethyltransferase
MNQVSEGKAKVYTGKGVFYNPKMSELRNLSVIFLRAISTKHKRVLDSTAATGIRAIRYAKEAGAKDVTLLDINKTAANLARKNVKLNKLKFKVIGDGLQEYANVGQNRFDIIDHDPFGSPAPNIFDLMKLSVNGTVLMLTATDTAVLCGAHPGACIKMYGSKPLHNEMCKEVGIRILLNYTARMASQFNFGIVPLVSISDMHYMRIFIMLDHGAEKAVESMKTGGIGTFCAKCYEFRVKKGLAPLIADTCPNCGSKVESFGPLWLGELYDKELLKRMLDIAPEGNSRKMIQLLYDELDVPLFYSVPRLTKHLGLTSTSHYAVMQRLEKLGAQVTRTQFDPTAFKTDATSSEVINAVKSLNKK